ncbi:Cys-tRNA(Pro) deacylase [Atopobium deltae]|uniref:Cys-tRNA(Pro)/Cys-tRNA(Cys) deacylase n=1 Tax=Atopobium deltae TaxID=1393034 RepID=A0A133XXK3_9ACTN|nr:Cys-tRNA(Pro) deacylase [Atopobium deltae]KXB35643.1 YbaK/EbsC protein [Atopobium deltae]
MSKKAKLAKTNAMRELDRVHVTYNVLTYDAEHEDLSTGVGVRIAQSLGRNPAAAFKTLVTVSPSKRYVVCCIPVDAELDLKKAAASVQEKSLHMLPMNDLEATTGYVRGGCSPIGMKKQFYTCFDQSALQFERIGVSGGKRGISLELNPEELAQFLGGHFADLTQEKA